MLSQFSALSTLSALGVAWALAFMWGQVAYGIDIQKPFTSFSKIVLEEGTGQELMQSITLDRSNDGSYHVIYLIHSKFVEDHARPGRGHYDFYKAEQIADYTQCREHKNHSQVVTQINCRADHAWLPMFRELIIWQTKNGLYSAIYYSREHPDPEQSVHIRELGEGFLFSDPLSLSVNQEEKVLKP